jgi:hypothetical protein
MADGNTKMYTDVTEAAAEKFLAEALSYGLILSPGGTVEGGRLSGHGVTVEFAYWRILQRVVISIEKKEGFAWLLSDEQIFAEIDKFVGAPAVAA